jgi:hypothetical protein
VSGENLDIKGQQSVSFGLGGQEFKHEFLVYSLPTETSGLLGIDFMESRNGQLSLKSGEMSTTVDRATPQEHGTPRSKRAVLTVFTGSKVFPEPSLREGIEQGTPLK